MNARAGRREHALGDHFGFARKVSNEWRLSD
jgi:hypothetical protein